jgi:A/G-specific adenine glycosylase
VRDVVRDVRRWGAMLTARELPRFRKELLAWFRQFQRDLPWRRTRDPYRIWVSEIMLQQTRVAAVIPYYERFLEKFPDVSSLAEAPQEDVLRLWSGLGYYSRARNLQAAAKEIVARHGGEFPQDLQEMLALPGIGRYTAAAILSIAHGAKLAVLDGNVARVLARLGAVRGDLRESRRWESLQKTANRMLAPKSPSEWNQAMMELGAMVCTPRAPQCLLCPAAKFCRARKLGIADLLPEKRKKRETQEVTIAAAIFLDSRSRTILLPPPRSKNNRGQSPELAPLVSNLWHFPSLQVGENASEELQQHLAAFFPKIPKRSLVLEPLPKARHAVTYRKITLLPFHVRVAQLPNHRGAKIVPLADVCSPASHAVSNLTRKLAHAALNGEESLAASA